jgi:uncharacterized membrane protein
MATQGLIDPASAFSVRKIGLDAPWDWLNHGFQNLKRAPRIALGYGMLVLIASYLLTAGLWQVGLIAWIPALGGGFLILSPLLAVGLYDASMRLDRNEAPRLGQIRQLDRESVLQLLYMGFLLAFLYLIWMRVGMLLYALFIDGEYYPFSSFIAHMVTTSNGLALMTIGTLIGAMIAFTAFAVSAISIPMLVTQRVDFGTAILTSLEAVRINFVPMLLWAWLIALFTTIAMATAFLGLVFVFPLIGFATWHAYRDLVESAPSRP